MAPMLFNPGLNKLHLTLFFLLSSACSDVFFRVSSCKNMVSRHIFYDKFFASIKFYAGTIYFIQCSTIQTPLKDNEIE
jgi:hypothetical protein